MKIDIPRVIISGLKGGSGKTIISLALARYFSSLNLKTRVFKKGPDYIDAGWLTRASGYMASNLDPFFMSEEDIKYLFLKKVVGFDLAIIEGNRGLFDGKDIDGSCSTAQLASVLSAPVILVIDCTKMTRTVVALINGCKYFEPEVDIKGVIFNNTGGERHRKILTRCVEKYTDVKVIGALPRFNFSLITERHMGLVSDKEIEAEKIIDHITENVVSFLDMDLVKQIAESSVPLEFYSKEFWFDKKSEYKGVNIGIVKDASLWFYYPENLEALERCGAKLVDVSLLSDKPWPEIHGLYLGGGFPETLAESLAKNEKIKFHILELANKNLPIYAECGGLMYLCKSLIYKEKMYPMVGIFPIDIELCKKPQGHGYTRVKVIEKNPFFQLGDCFTGHEFHYSRCITDNKDMKFCFYMERGVGIGSKRDGLIFKNILACYNHLHIFSNPKWALNFVKAALNFKKIISRIIPLNNSERFKRNNSSYC